MKTYRILKILSTKKTETGSPTTILDRKFRPHFGAKMEPTNVKKHDIFWICFGVDFCKVLDQFWEPFSGYFTLNLRSKVGSFFRWVAEASWTASWSHAWLSGGCFGSPGGPKVL
jgi:hypothetical protein